MSFKVCLSKLVLPHLFDRSQQELPRKMTPKTHPNRTPGFGPCFSTKFHHPHSFCTKTHHFPSVFVQKSPISGQQVLYPGRPGHPHWWKDEAPLNVAAGVGASFPDRWRANHVEQSLGAVDWEIG